jgi:hypothetical protein
LGKHEKIHRAHYRGNGGGFPAALSRENDQVAAQREDFYRLFSQLAGSDVSRGLLDARARRRADLHAGDLGGAPTHHGRQPVHHSQLEKISQGRSMGRDRQGQAKIAGLARWYFDEDQAERADCGLA